MTDPRLDTLLEFTRQNGRVCPMPQKWVKLWRRLPDRERTTTDGWRPSLPLILGAWSETSATEKQERLAEHLRWAADHGKLEKIERYLHALDEDD